jgi:Tetratricopeptide repeat
LQSGRWLQPKGDGESTEKTKIITARSLGACGRERALAIHEKALGPQQPVTAWSLTHLAVVLQAQRDYRRARPLSERALAIRERALGSGARPLCERALAMHEKALGPDHPDTASTLHTLGGRCLACVNVIGSAKGITAILG